MYSTFATTLPMQFLIANHWRFEPVKRLCHLPPSGINKKDIDAYCSPPQPMCLTHRIVTLFYTQKQNYSKKNVYTKPLNIPLLFYVHRCMSMETAARA